jgi:hypothetical protein
LRGAFLDGTAGQRDYWQTWTDLASYDQTFAQRIGWKWDHVLGELKRRAWFPPPGELCDWGCGSGIAGRAFLDHFGAHSASALVLHDRSPLACQFAARRAQDKYPELIVRCGEAATAPGVLLLSHVLTELDNAQISALAALAERTTAVIWIEPGTYEASRTLIGVRERLRAQFQVVAPCVHQGPCGMLTPGNARHWCHHFAGSPPEIYAAGEWARFAALAGVDLRSLPLSYLVLDKRPPAPLPADAFRIIGHPRVYKPYALIMGCDFAGVWERKLAKRNSPAAYRFLKKRGHPSLLAGQSAGKTITQLTAWDLNP